MAEALEAYPAPLLGRSGALAVQLHRDRLDPALGSAVRSSTDGGLLIRWLSTDMGSAASAAAESLGRLVGRGDAGTRGTCHFGHPPAVELVEILGR